MKYAIAKVLGSSQIFVAAYLLCTTSNLLLSDDMKSSGYKNKYEILQLAVFDSPYQKRKANHLPM